MSGNKDKDKMSDKLGKFFKKKKNEAKFKLGMSGPGHRLGDTSSTHSSSSSSSSGKPAAPAPRVALSSEARQAGAAALARFDKNDKPSTFGT